MWFPSLLFSRDLSSELSSSPEFSFRLIQLCFHFGELLSFSLLELIHDRLRRISEPSNYSRNMCYTIISKWLLLKYVQHLKITTSYYHQCHGCGMLQNSGGWHLLFWKNLSKILRVLVSGIILTHFIKKQLTQRPHECCFGVVS